MFDDINLETLNQIATNMNHENIGDSMERGIALQAAITEPLSKAESERCMVIIRKYARDADIGWPIFLVPIKLEVDLSDNQVLQLMGLSGTLLELNYCFERIEEATLFTFPNSAPVRFYVNGLFHYISALFLIDRMDKRHKHLPYPGTVINVLHPIGLSRLLDPVYVVLDRPFGQETSYGGTILKNRNKQFVHGTFSPENIQGLVKDTNIFDEPQKARFMQNHWDLLDRLIVLRLQVISILTQQKINPADFSPDKIYNLSS
jgi:hypothetical protein